MEIQQVPESEYGYWVTEGAQILPVDYQRHQRVARREGGFDNMTRALTAGWIRIIAPPNANEDFYSTLRVPARRSKLAAVARIIEARPQYYTYFFEDMYGKELLNTDNEKKALGFLKTIAF